MKFMLTFILQSATRNEAIARFVKTGSGFLAEFADAMCNAGAAVLLSIIEEDTFSFIVNHYPQYAFSLFFSYYSVPN
jgi:hypothetical protein